jgi:hypothetical protein
MLKIMQVDTDELYVVFTKTIVTIDGDGIYSDVQRPSYHLEKILPTLEMAQDYCQDTLILDDTPWLCSMDDGDFDEIEWSKGDTVIRLVPFTEDW